MKSCFYLLLLFNFNVLHCFSQTDSTKLVLDENGEYKRVNIFTGDRGKLYKSIDFHIGGMYQVNTLFYQIRCSKRVARHLESYKYTGFSTEFSPYLNNTFGVNVFYEKSVLNKDNFHNMYFRLGAEFGYYTNFNEVNQIALKTVLSYSWLGTLQCKPLIFIEPDFKSVSFNVQFSFSLYLPIQEFCPRYPW